MISKTFKTGWLVRLLPALLAFGGAHSQAQAPAELKAMAQLQPGLWEFKSKEASANRTLCLSDVKAMLQFEHIGKTCRRFVIANETNRAVVNYVCPANGNGQTTVRVETPRLVQVETQGLLDRSPFAYVAEGRRISACAGRPIIGAR